MADDSDGGLTLKQAPQQGLAGFPIPTADLTPHYANSAQIQFSPYEFMLTFLRAEYLLQGPGPDDGTPVVIAARVALSHRGMKEFLNAAIANYQMFVAQNPGADQFMIFEDAADAWTDGDNRGRRRGSRLSHRRITGDGRGVAAWLLLAKGSPGSACPLRRVAC